MLGIFRFFLANCVMAFHLTAMMPMLGVYAVNSFYVISGFLITLILNKTYHFNFFKFSINRFLRLYPSYFIFLLMGFIIIYLFPSARLFHTSWSGNFLPGDYLGNLLIFPWAFLSDNAVTNPFAAFIKEYPFHVDGNRFRIVTSSWSVAVELVCYFLLWFIIAKKWYFSFAALVLSTIYHVYVYYQIQSFQMAYFSFVAALLPFSIGSASFFLSEKIKKSELSLNFSTKTTLLFLCIIIFCTNWYLSECINPTGWIQPGYYINNVISSIIVMTLIRCEYHGKLKEIAKSIGDMAYPVFLCHYFCGYFSWLIIGTTHPTRGWGVFLLAYPISILLSILCVNLIDNKFSKMRDFIRNGFN